MKQKEKILGEVKGYLKRHLKKTATTKLTNVTGKTGRYNVPAELYQKRTSRANRVLISWKTVKKNNLKLKHLMTFDGGVVVEFINDDYFNEQNFENELFQYLVNRVGSDEKVSSMISIRSEIGSSSSRLQRENYQKLINNTRVYYQGKEIIINENNLRDYIIRRKPGTSYQNKGNEHWEGFIYFSIKGGQQETLQSHKESTDFSLFNPACEYLNEELIVELQLVSHYFVLVSLEIDKNMKAEIVEYQNVLNSLRYVLEKCIYSSEAFKGNLLTYCENHPSTSMKKGELYDPIQVVPIKAKDFEIFDKYDDRNLNLAHDEAVNKDRYYWDDEKNVLLSAARPSNIFWSRQLSNMMQQNFTLEEYFEHQEKITIRRKELLSNND
ncbi:hypothetical protein [Jeotgalicoccus meleagridis]|uniref:Uncharacterized protein n=1 Tax=Jeotgalicoccus meleagridis TaxID=2759181 RepID=A0A6V7R3J2_9STAP|nr:hypothetical protein [Jeotgalicoccus meleagridis]CAD2071623.1 hypothetical protein JEODO184_00323 [Jeotgalicoccus meleagridis]